MDIESLLHQLRIEHKRYDHPAVFSTKESTKINMHIPGAHTKQLLMSEEKGDRIILAIVMHDKKVDMNAFAKQLASKRLQFASPELLFDLLHVTPGSVTPFGLMFDQNHRIEVIVDEDAWKIGTFQFHPLINTATITIDKDGFEAFLRHTGHRFSVATIPNRIDSRPDRNIV